MVENLRVEPEIDARRVNYLIDLEQKGEVLMLESR